VAAGALPARAGEPGDARPRARISERRARKEASGGSPYLGISLLDLTADLRAHFGAPKDSGVLVSEVAADTPASRCGIAVGDVVTRVDGDPVESFWDVSRALRDKKKGDRVEIEVIRDRAARKLTATVDERQRGLLGEGLPRRLMAGDPGRTIVLGGDEFSAEPFKRMEELFRSPEWKERLGGVDECERVRERLETVEERLRALEQKLPGR
jgi:membrane-associated protease RseP (regulator of RpoE activity)